MSTRLAQPEMHPRIACLKTVFAARSARRDLFDLIEMRTLICHTFTCCNRSAVVNSDQHRAPQHVRRALVYSVAVYNRFPTAELLARSSGASAVALLPWPNAKTVVVLN